MKLSTLLTIASLLAIAFGLAFTGEPAIMLTQYGLVVDPASAIMSRFFGATLITLGLVIFLARSVTDAYARNAIVQGLLVGSLLSLAVAVFAQVRGVINAFGWSTVAIYGLLTLGYVYFALGARGRGENRTLG
ncbi:MAG: hypothetical protein ACHQRL_07870 [Gemmatimonadales bacterium]|jgi:hypothetical protein